MLGRIPYRSIKFQVVMAILIVIIPLTGLLVYNYYYSVNVLHDQVAKSHKNTISLYMNQMDLQLQEVDKYFLRKFLIGDAYSGLISDQLDKDDRVLAKIRLMGELTEDILVYPLIDSFFVYFPSENRLLEVFNSPIDYQQKVGFNSYIKDLLSPGGGPPSNRWFLTELGGGHYLFKIMKVHGIFVGAWLNTENVLAPLQLVDMGEKGAPLLMDKGEVTTNDHLVQTNAVDLSGDFSDYYVSGHKNKFLIVGENSSVGDFSLVALVPDESVLADMPYLKRVIIWIAFISLLTLPAGITWLNYFILNPLNRILDFMRTTGTEEEAHDGLKGRVLTSELRVIVTTFNRMLERIRRLKIDVYEEQLNQQKAELKHLQLQVRPHFFLNSLNIIYSLAQMGDYAKIQEMISYLTNYFRYVFTLALRKTQIQLSTLSITCRSSVF